MLTVFLLVLGLPILIDSVTNNTECPNLRADLSALRKRRHITFPDGSNIVDKLANAITGKMHNILQLDLIVTDNASEILHFWFNESDSINACIVDDNSDIFRFPLVKAFMTHAPAGWNIALEIDVLFPLPDANFTLAKHRRKLHHRQKREFWDRLKGAMDLHNINGRSCVLKSICDARAYLLPPGVSLIHDILRAVFTVPKHEEAFMEEVRPHYNELENPDFCDNVSDCPFSLLNFVTDLNLIN